ncbi:MAG: hypothetical protein HC832_04385 [Leptolyngbyaceae cyanobacterium RM1_405_57]|nr:hypothetical protein [Leptolyngbyaceae cyanobacterium RM1_405_57]
MRRRQLATAVSGMAIALLGFTAMVPAQAQEEGGAIAPLRPFHSLNSIAPFSLTLLPKQSQMKNCHPP